MPEFTLDVLNSDRDSLRLSVRIPETNAPLVEQITGMDQDGRAVYESVRDHGTADWPDDEEIAARASEVLGYRVSVDFCDRGDDLLEGIYDARPLDATYRVSYVDDDRCEITAEYTVEIEEALARGVREIQGEIDGDRVIYHAHETGEDLAVGVADVARFGATLLYLERETESVHGCDAYSLWASSVDAEIVEAA